MTEDEVQSTMSCASSDKSDRSNQTPKSPPTHKDVPVRETPLIERLEKGGESIKRFPGTSNTGAPPPPPKDNDNG